MLVIRPESVTAWQLPEDGPPAREAFLKYFLDPAETWLRAYSLTMEDLANAIIQAHLDGILIHLYVDRSQSVSRTQKALVTNMVHAGVEVTIGTSPAGKGYIAHEKGYTTAEGDCWEGSVNFSHTGWEQVNTALQFNSPEWRDMTIAAFNRAVDFAWAHERNYQLMDAKPAARWVSTPSA